MFAFSTVSAIKSPPLLGAGMPELSVLIDFMYWNSFFMFGLVVGLVHSLVDHR
jgi:hypothetical protein